MKRVIAIFLVLMLLTGCTTVPDVTTAATTAAPTEPVQTLYDPESYIEEFTQGAVRGYPLTGLDAVGFDFLGSDLVLFTMDDHVSLTTLHLLRGAELGVVKSLTLDCALYPDDAHLRFGEQSLSYYNEAENSIVILDGDLTEKRRIQLPDEVTDTPLVSGDLSTLYYCAGEEIRALDLETGVSRLLKQHSCTGQSLSGLHFDDTVLEVFVTEEGGGSHVAFVSTQSGETVGTDPELLTLRSGDGRYVLQRMDATVVETLVGKAGEEPQSLHPNQGEMVFEAFSMNAVLAGSGDTLELYDLGSGEITSRLSLGDEVTIRFAAADPAGSYVWILGFDSELNCAMLYRWDVKATEVIENAAYLTKRYTAEEPDTAGIAACQTRADAIGEAYGVKIVVGDGVTVPDGYKFSVEYQVEAIDGALDQLEQTLARFPEGFFTGLSAVSKSGTIHIGLVREMEDNTGLSVPDGTGLHYVLSGDHYIALTVGTDPEQALVHQICHVLDSFVYGGSKAYDDWEELNPKGFAYFGSYQYTPVSADDPALTGDTRAFVDSHAMTFPKEDRARIFEYAMTEGNEAVFASQTMQEKLQRLCTGIREAFGWEELEEPLPWEQYLPMTE